MVNGYINKYLLYRWSVVHCGGAMANIINANGFDATVRSESTDYFNRSKKHNEE
jgi:hypothetical protein